MTPTLLTFLLLTQPALEVVAHRGVHQTFDRTKISAKDCNAAHIDPPQHRFIENTLPAISAAFAAGATLVEIDFHRTADNSLAVFQDWTLECRTNGHGETRRQTMAYLKTLDVGYGYTADGGKTFPLRGSGIGLLPSLAEVLDAFPSGRFVLTQKDGDVATAELLGRLLASYPQQRRMQLLYWGGAETYATVASLAPEVRRVAKSPSEMMGCAKRYFAYGWLGIFPDECSHAGLVVPLEKTSRIWGWPKKFLARARAAGSNVFVVGVNSVEGLDAVWDLPIQGIVTDKVEIVGPLVRALSDERTGRARLE